MMEQALGRATDDVVGEKPAESAFLSLTEGLNGPRLSGVVPVGVEVISHSRCTMARALRGSSLVSGMSLGPDGEAIGGVGLTLGQVRRGFVARDNEAGLVGSPAGQVGSAGRHCQGDELVGGEPNCGAEVAVRCEEPRNPAPVAARPERSGTGPTFDQAEGSSERCNLVLNRLVVGGGGSDELNEPGPVAPNFLGERQLAALLTAETGFAVASVAERSTDRRDGVVGGRVRSRLWPEG